MMRLIFISFFTLLCINVSAQNFDHSKWQSILQSYVSHEGHVNYKAIKANESELDVYLDQLANVNPDNYWTRKELLTYWINAYNAFTIKLIIDNYPLKSIKDIKQPWDIKFITIAGKTMSLNQIEHDILRTMNEPRIHFAINCASVSCPKLLNEAFISTTLENQLHRVTINFINEGNTLSKNKIELSKIFKWFREDFEKSGTLIDFLNDYSPVRIDSKAKIKYKDYNWNLNE